MQCPRCQQENPPQAKFCLECGARLALRCTQCGTELPAGAKFCLECGQPVGARPTLRSQFISPETYTPRHLAEKILTSKSALEGERKQVTVLFADLKGSMELLADRDPEDARRLLDPVLEHMMEAVHCYEGTVNQVMGDGIMALFGAPLAHEDHAVRACYAALRMQASVQRHAADVRRAEGVPLQIRVGLNSGEVVVRSIGSDLHMDYTAVGQTTHLAARMEQLATPGATLLTAATLPLVEGFVQAKALGPVPVKGLTAPVEVYELVGATAVRRRLQAAAARGLTRFIGRQTELATLADALARAGAGHGQVVALVGEAGVGKSRLVYECLHTHHTHDWLVLESASVSYGKATPYFPIIDLLKRYCHVEERDDPRTIRAKVTGQVLTLDAALQDAVPALLALLDALPEDSPFLRLDPPQGRQRTLEARARQLDDRARLGGVLSRMVSVRQIIGNVEGALAAGQEALELAATLGDPALHVHASYRLGQTYAGVGDYNRAAEMLRGNVEALARSTPGDMRLWCIKSQAWLAEVLSILGEFAEGRRHGEEALRLIMVEGREDAQINARARLGCLYLAQGDLEAAIRVFDQGLALCRTSGQRASLGFIAGGLGEAYAHTGRLAEGLALLEEARRDDLRTGALGGAYGTHLRQLSAVSLLAGRFDEAWQHACQALDLARQLKARGNEAHALFQLGAVHAQASPPDVQQAEARYQEALMRAEALGMRPLQAHCHLSLGTLYGKLGRQEEARAELSAAIALYRAMEMTFWLPQAEAVLAQAGGASIPTVKIDPLR